jgi:hypothetical protein
MKGENNYQIQNRKWCVGGNLFDVSLRITSLENSNYCEWTLELLVWGESGNV